MAATEAATTTAHAQQKPRFKVGSVTGYSISDWGHGDTRRPATVWYVQDTAFCYQTVREYKGFRARECAVRDAELLNAGGTLEPQDRRRTRTDTHCANGHELSPHNIYVEPKTGRTRCRVCHYDTNMRYQQRRKSADV